MDENRERQAGEGSVEVEMDRVPTRLWRPTSPSREGKPGQGRQEGLLALLVRKIRRSLRLG
jgi:hypothetical protein